MNCPLCNNERIQAYHQDGGREYVKCTQCDLVFVPEEYHLAPEREREIYELHENSPEDQGYRRFLSRLFIPMSERLTNPAQGLDFGCGPGPTLSRMFTEHGFAMDLYDPFFLNDPKVFTNRYDFICASEVVEHLRRPGEEFDSLFSMLLPGGWLGIMTKMVRCREAFAQWHYIRDLTHICFYSMATFTYLADRHHCRLYFYGDDVVLLRKVSRQQGDLYP